MVLHLNSFTNVFLRMHRQLKNVPHHYCYATWINHDHFWAKHIKYKAELTVNPLARKTYPWKNRGCKFWRLGNLNIPLLAAWGRIWRTGPLRYRWRWFRSAEALFSSRSDIGEIPSLKEEQNTIRWTLNIRQ